MITQSQQLKQTQKLSPQQIQLMKLIQIPTAMFDQRVQEELEANPALESADDFTDLSAGLSSEDIDDNYHDRLKKDVSEDIASDGDSTDSDDDSSFDDVLDDYQSLDSIKTTDFADDDDSATTEAPDYELDDYLLDYIEDDPTTYKTRGDAHDNDEEERTIPIAVENTFHEHLEEQLGVSDITNDRERLIALQIIGSIDDDGYLRREPAAIANDLILHQSVVATEKEVLKILAKIQQFDPPGTGARNLQECLLIQLRQKLASRESKLSDEEKYLLKISIKIINEHFDEFTKKHYSKLAKQLDIEEEDLKEAMEIILKLNPKPASGFATRSDRAFNYVVPDFLVSNKDGELELTLNARNAPDLRINDQYRDMLKSFYNTTQGRRATQKEKDAILFIKQKIDSAKWFIDAIKQRQQTMLQTMGAILNHQHEYFLTGDQKKIKPMILKDIADVTQLDISTVSRVANSKYVQTEFGTKRLKEFFSESLQNEDGEEVSTLEVKKILTEIISEENKRRPLSDEKLKSILTKKGYNIARRTVAKYREQLNIPVARLRKTL